MIAKNIKGKSFKGSVSYVMHEGAALLEAEGVLADSTKDIIRSFAMQRSGRKEIKQPVGHIPLSFSPEDKGRMTDEFMVQLAKEYMQEMGIKNTQYIIVRHENTDNPHLHIVYNRIDNDLKLISVNHDYKRNIKVCKKLKDKHGLTYGEGKENVKREKLDNPDKAKYKIYDAVRAILPQCTNPDDLRLLLMLSDIETEFKLKRTTGEIEGISFRQDNICFKGSEVDRKFSYGNLKKEFEKNKELQEKQKEQAKEQTVDNPKTRKLKAIGGITLTPEQLNTLEDGGYIYLENMQQKDGSNISAYLFFDDQMKQSFYTRNNPESFVKYGQYEMHLMDKIRIESGLITKATVKWWGGGSYAHPYLWKENKSDPEYKESWGDPRLPKVEKEKIEKQPDLSKNLNINKGRKM